MSKITLPLYNILLNAKDDVINYVTSIKDAEKFLKLDFACSEVFYKILADKLLEYSKEIWFEKIKEENPTTSPMQLFSEHVHKSFNENNIDLVLDIDFDDKISLSKYKLDKRAELNSTQAMMGILQSLDMIFIIE